MAKGIFKRAIDINKKVLVKNKKGTSNEELPYGIKKWLLVWEYENKKEATKCMSCNKSLDDFKDKIVMVGGHVRIANETTKGYIVPICSSCNGKGPEHDFYVMRDVLVDIAKFKEELKRELELKRLNKELEQILEELMQITLEILNLSD